MTKSIVWSEIGVPIESPFTLTITEGTPIVMNMVATVQEEIPPPPIPDPEIFPTPTATLISWTTPSGNPPDPISGGFTISGTEVIPPIEYRWVIDNVEYSANEKADVPLVIDFLTKMESDPTLQKQYDITIDATSTGSLGTVLNSSQSYILIIQNTWDADKAELNELLARGSL